MERPSGVHAAGPAIRGVLARRKGVWAGLLLTIVPAAARAESPTDVVESADPNRSFAFGLDAKYLFTQETGLITRQFTQNSAGVSYIADELNYKRTKNTLDLDAHFGLFKGFELHVDVPYVLSDEQNWTYATVNGASVESGSTIQNNTINADGNCVTSACTPVPLFSVPGTVYRGGFADPSFGFAWRLMDDAPPSLSSDWYPSTPHIARWVVGLDYTAPLAPVDNPSVTTPGTSNSGSPLAEGLGEHQLHFITALSKRLGPTESYIKIHYDLAIAASNAYDNCSISAENNPNHLYMSSEQATECGLEAGQDQYWVGKTGLQPPQKGGVVLGSDFIAFDTGRGGTSLDFALQLNAQYISKGRDYSELSDELHKLTYTDEYFDLGGQLSMDLRFVGIMHWVSAFSLSTFTSHVLTDESVGTDRNGDGVVTLGTNEVNPDYSFAVDQPGRQFEITSVMNVGFSTRLSVDF